jgi:hypothetical protein
MSKVDYWLFLGAMSGVAKKQAILLRAGQEAL